MSTEGSYADRLRQVIAESGMLLDINNYDGYEYFQLTSNRLTKQFITIWELFDEQDKFDECIEQLVQTAYDLKIDPRTTFTKIATSTNTVREIGKHLLPRLNTKLNNTYQDTVAMVHFGDYPNQHHVPAHLLLPNESVLLLADVIASGSLITQLADLAEFYQARVIGVLAVCVTSDEIITTKCIRSDQNQNYKAIYQRTIPVFSLTSYPIPQLTNDKQYITLKIDPVTILPIDTIRYPYQIDPCFNIAETFEHFDKSDAIEYGFFFFGTKRFTTAFKFTNLLDIESDIAHEIWGRIKYIVSEQQVLVTTYRKEDLDFLQFIQYFIKKEGLDVTTIITVKRDTKDTPYFYFTILNNRAKDLQGKKILLLLASLSTSEKLRNISSLLLSLATDKPTYSPLVSINVLCLVNRMGLYTSSFVTGINTLFGVSLKENATEKYQVRFDFKPVYNFKDFNTADLERMHQSINTVFQKYKRFTKVSYFRETASRYQALFWPVDYLDDNQTVTNRQLPETVEVVINQAEGAVVKLLIDSEKTLLAAINYQLATSRDYEILLRHFDRFTTITSLFHLVGLILIDVDYVRSGGLLKRLLIHIYDRVQGMRQERFTLEQNLIRFDISTQDSFNESITTEKQLLLCFAVLLNYESQLGLTDEDILSLFLNGTYKNAENEFPYNFKLYFEEATFMMCLSMVLSGRYQYFHNQDRVQLLKGEIRKAIQHLKEFIPTVKIKIRELSKQVSDTRKAVVMTEPDEVLIRNSLDLILQELGDFEQRRNHQIIRYLQKYTILNSNREQHNDLCRPIKLAQRYIKDALVEATHPTLTPKLTVVLKKAIYIASILQNVAIVTRHFFNFHVGSHDEHKQYLNYPEQEGFAQSVHQLEQALNAILDKNSVNQFDLESINILIERVFDEQILNPDSTLCRSLQAYIVSLPDSLVNALDDEISSLDKLIQKQANLFYIRSLLDSLRTDVTSQMEQTKQTEGNQYLALCDTPLLREAIRNIISNFNHSKLIENNSTISYRFFEEDREVTDVEEQERHVVLRFTVTGATQLPTTHIYDNRNFSIGNQAMMLRPFGGTIELINPNSENGSYTIELSLIARAGYRLIADIQESKS